MTLSNKKDIIAWLDKCGVENYTLVEDAKYGYVVDVEGSVNFFNQNLGIIPVQFGRVTGDFNCAKNKITSLEGAPHTVGGYFYCQGNQLATLQYAPSSVDGSFGCGFNKLKNLLHAPIFVGGDFGCNDNEIVSLEYYPNSVGGDFYCYNNLLIERYQDITDFSEIKTIILSEKEEALLSASLDQNLKSNVLKL